MNISIKTGRIPDVELLVQRTQTHFTLFTYCFLNFFSFTTLCQATKNHREVKHLPCPALSGTCAVTGISHFTCTQHLPSPSFLLVSKGHPHLPG